MTDNSENRKHDVFFYGLYMDPDILKSVGVKPNNPRIGYVENYKLRIGNKATLLRAPGEKANGVVYSLSHSDINKLYWDAGLKEYVSEALMAKIGTETIPVLCCNLLVPPNESESNQAYAEKLKVSMNKLGIAWNMD
jgi:hypothetical protein